MLRAAALLLIHGKRSGREAAFCEFTESTRLRRKRRPQGENLHLSRAPAPTPPPPQRAPAAASRLLLRLLQNLPLPPRRSAPRRRSAPPKEGPVALDNDLVKRYKEKFGPAILEAWTDRKQAILVVARELLAEIAIYSRDDEKFDWLSDLTAVDWPKREKRFDVVLNMYSFEKNERLRLKAHAAADERVPSVQGIWSTANWMEREVYDMFGVVFEGHPDLKRILLPGRVAGLSRCARTTTF